RLPAATARWPRGGAFGPLIRGGNGDVYPSAGMLPALGRGIGHALLCGIWPTNPWTRAYQQATAEITERPAEWLSGACLLLRREAFDSVNGFDPRYFMYFEDVDLGDRLGRAGWRNVYVPSAEVVHIGGTATERASARMLTEHHRSAYRYLADRYRGPVWGPLRLAVRVGLGRRAQLLTRTARSERPGARRSGGTLGCGPAGPNSFGLSAAWNRLGRDASWSWFSVGQFNCSGSCCAWERGGCCWCGAGGWPGCCGCPGLAIAWVGCCCRSSTLRTTSRGIRTVLASIGEVALSGVTTKAPRARARASASSAR